MSTYRSLTAWQMRPRGGWGGGGGLSVTSGERKPCISRLPRRIWIFQPWKSNFRWKIWDCYHAFESLVLGSTFLFLKEAEFSRRLKFKHIFQGPIQPDLTCFTSLFSLHIPFSHDHCSIYYSTVNMSFLFPSDGIVLPPDLPKADSFICVSTSPFQQEQVFFFFFFLIAVNTFNMKSTYSINF